MPETSGHFPDRSGEPRGGFSLQSRLDFLELTEEDARKLRETSPLFAAYADEFVDAFYRHLFAFPETARFLQDASLVERLKQAQRSHLESMLAAQWDEAYVERRRKVGQTHSDVGIDAELFLGAYNQYVQLCFRRFTPELNAAHQAELERLLAVLKAVFLDIGLTLEAYFQQSTQTLRKALDMYWQANAELKQFARLTSHDLKTPLATVANLCDEALDEFGNQMPNEARTLIEAARQRTFRMSDMIDELLTSAVPVEGIDVEEEVVTSAALAEAIERLKPALEAKGISLTIADPIPHVWGNRVWLREAFYNVLSNAAKFIEEDPKRIRIGAESKAETCVISICDNGPGIPREELQRIFVPFRRLPAHRNLPGSGLGLYFTRSLIEHQGGKIWAESEIGQGACFYLSLRRSPPATKPAAD